MTRFLVRAGALAAVLVLAGCARQAIDTPEDNETHLSEECPIDLAAWLGKPRAELAKLADEHEEMLEKQREGFRNQDTDEMLLPTLVAPARVAVFRKAKYHEAIDLS